MDSAEDLMGWAFGADGVLARKLGGNYEVRQGQIEMARAWLRAIEDDRSLFAEGPTGCHAPGQGILMFDGSICRVEDIRVGDLLMGPDSRPREVLKLRNGENSMIDIHPVKGSVFRVDVDHILTLAKTGTGELKDISVREWIGWSKTQKHLWKLTRTGVSFPGWRGYSGERHLPIDPYFLGVLLGDGSLCKNGSVSVTKGDEEIYKCVLQQAELLNMLVRTRPDRDNQYYITAGPNAGSASNPIIAALRDMGLHRAGAGEKFIPYPYKVASREDRLDLIAGLMDTDGSYVQGCYDYISKSDQLVRDITFVAQSLGFASYPSPCTKKCQNDFEGEYFRTCISGELSEIPCRIPRKQAQKREQIKSVLRTGFDIYPKERGEYFGFTVSDDGRYLLDDFTITHNCGKSFAYLTPAIQQIASVDKSQAFEPWAENNRAVVVTANIALQEQLVEKDLPTLQRILPWEFSFGLLKGRSNYACRAKMEGREFKDAVVKDLSAKRAIQSWYQSTATGDRSELDFNPGRVWGHASSGQDECMGKKCPSYDACFANEARKEAVKKDIVVTNYHVMLVARAILKSFRILICDEAHALAQIARSALGWNISQGTFKRISSMTRKNSEKVAGYLDTRSDALFQAFENTLGRRQSVRLHDWDRQVNMKVTNLLTALKNCLGLAEDTESAASASMDVRGEAKAKMLVKQIGNVMTRLEAASEGKPESWVLWLQKHQSSGAMLSGAPVILNELLPHHLFGRAHSTLLTSATMTSGGSFEFMRQELGLENAGELIAPSPFDLKHQGVVVVPRDIPPPPRGRDRQGEQEWLDGVVDAALSLMKMCDGRCLLLFTSWKTLNYVHNELESKKLPWPIYKQGDLPPAKLIAKFKNEVDSVLLGVASLWEGIDVPGEALTGLLIDKVPFPVPVDPINEAVGEWVEANGGSSFFDFSIPKATISLCQGVGRLIRTKTDKGVVIITDRRLIDKGYGEDIIRSLPPFFKTQLLEDAEKMVSR